MVPAFDACVTQKYNGHFDITPRVDPIVADHRFRELGGGGANSGTPPPLCIPIPAPAPPEASAGRRRSRPGILILNV